MIPIRGTCPVCGRELLWGELVRRLKAVERRKQNEVCPGERERESERESERDKEREKRRVKERERERERKREREKLASLE